MTITTWLNDERPREKLLLKGAAALSDAELLAIILRIGKKGKTAVDLARDLLIAYGGLNNLLIAERQHICQHSGMGISKYAQLQAAVELARRQLQQNLTKKDVLTNPITTKQYLIAKLADHQQEVFAALFLDNRNQIIKFEKLFFGTINNSAIYPREIARKALNYNASAIILAHNHPSGITTPSQADKMVTKQLIQALALIEIKVLDHIIVGNKTATSFVELKLMG